MTEFTTPTDIGNRALQHCGASRIDPTLGFLENSKAASEIGFCYGKLRRAELRRNVWTFATRRAVIRPIGTDTMLLAAALWVESTTYFVGCIVADAAGNLWISNTATNLGNNPALSTTWEPYFGPLTVSLYDAATAYAAGDLVYSTPGDGTARTYLSLTSNNQDNPATASAYAAAVTYRKNQVVTSAAIAYMSLLDLNLGQTPASSPLAWTTSFTGGTGSAQWLQIGGTEFPMGVGLTTMGLAYPLGAGPSSQSTSRNVFKLPAGFLRMASQNPKATTPALGAPSGYTYNDWNLENGFLISVETGPIALRFVADVTDVRRMDDLFCEMFAARIGLEVCEPLTQSSAKLGTIAKIYQEWRDQASVANAIEQGYEDPPIDDYVNCRQ